MEDTRSGPEWEELGRIDYFLDQLARAVERGEVPRESYDRLAPRYLERRTDLASVIDRRAERHTIPQAHAPVTRDAGAAETGGRHPAGPTGREQPAAVYPRPIAAPGRQPSAATHGPPPTSGAPREPVQVPWTTVLTFVGAFLVVVAAAIFAVATWDVFAVGFKLAFMGTLTAAFYGAAEFVDRKLRLRAGTYALATVAAAMLLFDGWIVIDGNDLQGAWPWALLLLVCSVVYWAMELRLTGGFFGVIGAAAQVGWWWLMAAGLGWTNIWRIAGMAVIAILWAQVARRLRGGEAITTISRILGWGALGIVAVGAVVALGDIIWIGRPTWSEIAATAIIALASVLVLWDHYRLPLAMAGAGSLPFIVAVGAAAASEPGWGLAAVMLVSAVVYALIEIFKRTWVFAGFALLAELGFWLLALDLWGATPVFTLGAIAGLAVSWIVAAALIEKWDVAPDGTGATAPEGTESLRTVAEIGGWAVLALTTLGIPLAAEEMVPLAGHATSAGHAWVATWIAALWLGASFLRKQAFALAVGILGTFYATAAFMGLMAPDWRSASYAAGLAALAIVWSQLGPWIGPRHGLRSGDVTLGTHALALAVPLGGLVAALGFDTFDEWPTAILLGVAALYWLADIARNRTALSQAPFGAALVGTAAAAVLAASSAEDAALAAGGVAIVLVVLGGLLRIWRPSGVEPWGARALVVGVGSAATFASLVQLAAGDSGLLAANLALVAVVWAVGTWVGGLGVLAAVSGLFALGATFASLDAAEADAWFTVVACAVFALGLLAPAWWQRGRASRTAAGVSPAAAAGLTSTASYSLVIVAAFAAVAPLVFAFVQGMDPGSASSWIAVSEHQLVVALLVLGGWTLTAGRLFDAEAAIYPGAGVIVGAALLELSLVGVESPYVFTTVIALYLSSMGYLYARLDPARRVPTATDLAAVAVGIGMPALWVLSGGSPSELLIDAFWTIGISVFAIGAGIVMRVRAYFFGGVALIVWVSFWRSLSFLVVYWWLALGLIGVAMLVIALTWERQRMILAETQARVRTSFEGWR